MVKDAMRGGTGRIGRESHTYERVHSAITPRFDAFLALRRAGWEGKTKLRRVLRKSSSTLGKTGKAVGMSGCSSGTDGEDKGGI
ncbi:hypothetical protein E2C01_081263 [Portunus trituberculatus]|uniref:Uncharacterized protein n=1 Tax=Portunus trituberculatus TaxID=210409 RepID=A0A5B7IVC4_PORTR|nr:hypothetical protein [Portunus trituberculatus]